MAYAQLSYWPPSRLFAISTPIHANSIRQQGDKVKCLSRQSVSPFDLSQETKKFATDLQNPKSFMTMCELFVNNNLFENVCMCLKHQLMTACSL